MNPPVAVPSPCVLHIRPFIRVPTISYTPNNPAPRVFKRPCTEWQPSTFISGRTTLIEETGPLLRRQRTERSYQTLVVNGNTPKVNDKVAPRVSHVLMLVVLWSALFFWFIGWYVIPPISCNLTQLYPCKHRNYCRDVALSHRCTLQSIKSIVLHRDCLSAVCILLHAIIQGTIGHSWT